MSRASNAVKQWTREKPEAELLPMETIGLLSEAFTLIVRGRIERLFAQHKLKSGEFDVLATLRRAGAPFTLTPTQLYDTLMISSGGMTNRLDRLEKAGYLRREPNPEDRRGTLVALTDVGLALIEHLFDLHLANEQQALTALSEDEQRQLAGLLHKLVEAQGNE
ncbi:MarR family winged helix-turn-helix transcriptional regulator [Polycladidibacter hongkongensis]|uniref:MarR family winged helix-turn-helix transcriptional regulator n=1 Tax=Polycladidibacter hongkongensis TaxID=1647556 RepID=UPI00082D47B0|nr:MarR family transcriptional regulator [Pseudovibrio hongkongensis]